MGRMNSLTAMQQRKQHRINVTQWLNTFSNSIANYCATKCLPAILDILGKFERLKNSGI